MKRLCYDIENLPLFIKEERKEYRGLHRPLLKTSARWRLLLGFAASGVFLATLWWFGAIGPEALLGLIVFGAIWGGDMGPGSDGPPGPGGEVDWVKLLGGLLSSFAPGPSEEFSWTPHLRFPSFRP